jgi:pyrimidine-specific ribonucleoside hydrolase
MPKIYRYLWICIFCFLTPFSWATMHLAAQRDFIIDTDVGVDDILAIAYILHRPEITVKAITIESNGNAHCAPAYANLFNLLKLQRKMDIPIACGRSTSFPGGHQFPDATRKYFDTFMDNLLPKSNVIQQGLGAQDLLFKTLHSAPQPMDILALGPLTTIAETLDKHPELKNKIRMIYLMGGAISVPGNILDVDPAQLNKVAEWNIYFDPYAAKKVFESHVPITLVPLDVTNQANIDLEFYNKMNQRKNDTSLAAFIFKLLDRNKQMILDNNWYFWDPMAAVISSNESIAIIKTLPLSVLVKPERLSGKTVIDKEHGRPIRVCLGIDSKKFKEILLNTWVHTYAIQDDG